MSATHNRPTLWAINEERMMAKTILAQDTRPITGIFWPLENEQYMKVGREGVTKIEAYDEYGIGDMVPWLAVYKGDEIISRIPAHHVEIAYAHV